MEGFSSVDVLGIFGSVVIFEEVDGLLRVFLVCVVVMAKAVGLMPFS